jgi:hypothetical protein
MDATTSLLERYEQLRTLVVSSPHVSGLRPGWGVLIQRGMSAWIDVCRTSPPPPGGASLPASTLPVSQPALLIGIVAAMILNHRTQEQTS